VERDGIGPTVSQEVQVGKLLFTPDEAAFVLGISRSKMYALLANGQVPRVLVGSVIRVPRVALEAWIKGQTASCPAASSRDASEDPAI
jgi:excisionase family DNA binding protein